MEPTKMDLSEIIEQERYTKRKQKLGLCLSLFGLILLAPLLLLIALSIKLENPRAQVLFKQKRVGKAGKEFWMYKFRTMQEDAEKQLQHYLLENEIEGAMFKMKNDPRITQVGRFLRKTSLMNFRSFGML
ncbi:undecaprenyl-phosphate galactosephosphotransferase [Listeria floridensis FSL S10-1187]|uniref:Undecaprenyl-phosphate galactosephosphotransferase n=1 Tax=Listeria floridensis FSL S10-1187 TaxID=1265817 RepID=A0ABP3AXI0_9LIST|nr:undecaprenyl-phosphate galactosephosphotransferase [Listeria floridensis FSL S10-1187]